MDGGAESMSTINEGAWNDIKNGVNPYSRKIVYHVSLDKNLDGKTLSPRIPSYITRLKKDGVDLDEYMKNNKKENIVTPRVCFSPSIEGCLCAIVSDTDQVSGKELYVYIPEKPYSEYKHKDGKHLYKDQDVFDAHLTKECWILEPVKLKFYGTIRVETISQSAKQYFVAGKNKKTAEDKDKIGKWDFKWKWFVHPSISGYGRNDNMTNSDQKSQNESAWLSMNGIDSMAMLKKFSADDPDSKKAISTVMGFNEVYPKDTCDKLNARINQRGISISNNLLIEDTDTPASNAFSEYVRSLEVEKPVLHNTPFFSPIELESLFVGSEDYFKYSDEPDTIRLKSGINISSWRENYIKDFYTGRGDNYQADWINTMRSLYADYDAIKESGDIDRINARKQSILNLGWNPEIDFNEKNMRFGKKRLLDEAASRQDVNIDYRCVYRNMENVTIPVTCGKGSGRIQTVFFVESDGKLGVDLDSYKLENICVISGKSDNVKTFEAFADKANVYMCTINHDSIAPIKGKLRNGFVLKYGESSSPYEVISEALDTLLDSDKNYASRVRKRIFNVYSGDTASYNEDAAFKTVNYMIREHKNEIVADSMTFVNEALEVDEDGTMIIYKAKTNTLDYGKSVNDSAKFCKIYATAGDIEGLKYELAKLYYINIMIEKRMGKMDSKTLPVDRNTLTNARRTCVNVFSQNMKKAITMDPEFNFVEYYNKSVYGGAIKISRNTFKFAIEAMVGLLKSL